MGRLYLLGHDLIPKDNLMDGFTFEDVIDALNCNEKEINNESVKRVVNEMLNDNLSNMKELLNNNMQEIINRVKAGRDDG